RAGWTFGPLLRRLSGLPPDRRREAAAAPRVNRGEERNMRLRYVCVLALVGAIVLGVAPLSGAARKAAWAPVVSRLDGCSSSTRAARPRWSRTSVTSTSCG